MKEEKSFDDLFKEGKIIVPSYQRAYSWEEAQLNQFVSDMLEIEEKGKYYFGHYILEIKNGDFEIIDGQQRITTFILFLMVCKSINKDELLNSYINKFETVDYDQESFLVIQKRLSDIEEEWKTSSFELPKKEQLTLSIQRVLFALNHFRKLFKDKKSKVRLYPEKISRYIEVLTQARISTHITEDKAVAVQIFELQNTRGIKLNIIEKVKAKLMKAVYLNAEEKEVKEKIEVVQSEFATIYELEEKTNVNAFRGELFLEDILLHHLRVVDDKPKKYEKSKFDSPSKSGNKEESILKYINDRIAEMSKTGPNGVVVYITELSKKFRESVGFVSNDLPGYDNFNRLIGDVLILEKELSLEFFILLFHLKREDAFKSRKIIWLWERLLFTRDFHDKYHGKVYRDDFAALFCEIVGDSDKLETILTEYVHKGFRPKLMDEGLPKTVGLFIKKNENNLLNNSFYFWTEKMVYVLYKYEIYSNADLTMLRNIMKEGRSIEHILPQSWESCIKEGEESDFGKEFKEKIGGVINGLGNLLLITVNENSRVNDTPPKDKQYDLESYKGGSYTKHNENREQWGDYNKWKEIIDNRGKEIFAFMQEWITISYSTDEELLNNNIAKNSN